MGNQNYWNSGISWETSSLANLLCINKTTSLSSFIKLKLHTFVPVKAVPKQGHSSFSWFPAPSYSGSLCWTCRLSKTLLVSFSIFSLFSFHSFKTFFSFKLCFEIIKAKSSLGFHQFCRFKPTGTIHLRQFKDVSADGWRTRELLGALCLYYCR